MHQLLGKSLAAFDDGGVFLRTEAGDSQLVQHIHAAGHQGIVRCDDGVVDVMGGCKGTDGGQVGGCDGNTFGLLCHAAVAGQGVNQLYVRVFLEGADDGMFSAAAADQHQFHRITS